MGVTNVAISQGTLAGPDWGICRHRDEMQERAEFVQLRILVQRSPQGEPSPGRFRGCAISAPCEPRSQETQLSASPPRKPARKGDPEWDTVQVITEHALLPVIPGREDEFEIAFTEARSIITTMPGCRGLTLSRSIESPSMYLLLVEWEQLDDHTIGFRQSDQYQEWRILLHHFYEPFPLVEHFQTVP